MYCCVPTVPTHPTKCRWAHATGKATHKRERGRKVALELKKIHATKIIPKRQVLHTTKYSLSNCSRNLGRRASQQQAKAIPESD